jgi:hypothetical protein
MAKGMVRETFSLGVQKLTSGNSSSGSSLITGKIRKDAYVHLRENFSIAPSPILGELPVLPLPATCIPCSGAGWPIGLIQIHPHEPRPVSTLVSRPEQPLNPGDNVVQKADHSIRLR